MQRDELFTRLAARYGLEDPEERKRAIERAREAKKQKQETPASGDAPAAGTGTPKVSYRTPFMDTAMHVVKVCCSHGIARQAAPFGK